MIYNNRKVVLNIDGINTNDYPDFVDAYATSGYYADTGRDLTDEELEDIHDNHFELIHEAVMSILF